MNPNITKIIELYLNNELSIEERTHFEQRMAENEALRKEVDLHRNIHDAAKRASIRTQVKKSARRFHITKALKIALISLGIATVASLGTYFAVDAISNSSSEIDSFSEELLNQLDARAQLEELESQYFGISAEGEAVLTKNGVLISVPKEAFLLNGKPYTGNSIVQVQEAIKASEIIKAGLSTMSGDKLLETQGMFAVQAFTEDGKKLDINPKVGVYMEVPVDENKEGMQLFEGVKSASGNIDWQNPKPLLKIPVPVNMTDLDFYPAGYETELDAQKWSRSKQKRDSLYLSFEDWISTTLKDSTIVRFPMINQNIGNTPKEENGFYHNVFVEREKDFATITIEYCVPQGSSLEEELTEFFHEHNSHLYRELSLSVSSLIDELGASCYVYKHKIKCLVDTDFSFDLFGSFKIKGSDGVLRTRAEQFYINVRNEDLAVSVAAVESDAVRNFILPSSVLAFWNPKFNNTNLSTREFEKRMQAIHNTCNNDVLKKYTSQLDKSLSEIDAEIVRMGFIDFQAFVDEQVGKVDLKNPHLKNLETFYTQAIAKLKQDAKAGKEKEQKRRNAFDSEVVKSRNKDSNREIARNQTALNEEYNFNLKNVKKLIGPSVGFTIKHNGGTIVNIDRYVWEATVSRTSTTVVDPISGQKAEILYNPFEFSVPNADKYLKLYTYIFPHELNSFQRIEGKNGSFNYPLNDKIIYDMAVVGITKEGYEYFQKQTFKSGFLGEIELKRISESKLNASIEQLNSSRISKPAEISSELTFLMKERANYVEQKQRMEMTVFRNKIAGILFKCGRCEEEVMGVTKKESLEFFK